MKAKTISLHSLRSVLLNHLLLPVVALTLLTAGSVSSQQTEPQAQATPSAAPAPRPVIDVCFVLDTTGSMSGLIESAKQKIWGIADLIARRQPAPVVRFALVGFRDRGDAYVTQITPLTEDLDAVYASLLKFKAEGGGDAPESVNQALHEAVTKLEWSKAGPARKLVFLAGDAPPHLDYPNDVPYTVTCALAEKRGIRINTLRCGSDGDTEKHWTAISELASGQFVSIPADGGSRLIETPFDKEMVAVSAQLNATVIAYGTAEQQGMCLAKCANAHYGSAEQIASRASWNSRGGKVQAISGNEDLTLLLQNGTLKPADIKKESLPAELKEADAAKLAEVIAERTKARAALQERLTALTAQRDQWLASPAAKALIKTSTFDSRINSMLAAQLGGC